MTTSVTRRAAMIGVATAAVASTAACATYGERAGAPAAEPAAAPGGPVARLASAAEIPVGGGIVLADQKIVVTQPTAGEFKAFSAVCTHQGCTVANVAGGTINCTCHGSAFGIADGAVKKGPATKPLAARNVGVSGDAVTLA